MNELIAEKVSDIDSDYPYLCIYFKNKKEPFMEVSINENNEYELIFYSHKENICITNIQLGIIIKYAESFKEEVLLNKEFY